MAEAPEGEEDQENLDPAMQAKDIMKILVGRNKSQGYQKP